MQLVLRFYYPSDTDLLVLRFKYGRKFPSLIRDILRSFIEEKTLEITIRETAAKYVRQIKKPVFIKINLKEGIDDKVIEYLSKISNRKRSDVVKNLIRGCYKEFPFGLYRFDNTSDRIFYKKEESEKSDSTAKKKTKINSQNINTESTDEDNVLLPKENIRPEENISHKPSRLKQNIDENIPEIIQEDSAKITERDKASDEAFDALLKMAF